MLFASFSCSRRFAIRVLLCAGILLLTGNNASAFDKRIADSLSHYMMGIIYDDSGEAENAIWEYKQALSVDSGNTAIHLNLAVSYIKHNQPARAVETLKAATKLDVDAVEAHALLALLYSLQNKAEDSNREYEIALKNASKLHPKNIEIYKNLGELYLAQKKFEAAESTYRLILQLSADDAEAYFYLAQIYDLKGNTQKAEEELKKSLALKPEYHEALNYLGYLYTEESKNLDTAEAMIKKALEFQPDNGAYVDSLGWLYFKKGKLEEAIQALTRAGILMQDPVIYGHLGDAYFAKKDYENARRNWERSLQLDPAQEKVKTKLGELKKQEANKK